jgi:ATP-dependent DNA helicase RecQ
MDRDEIDVTLNNAIFGDYKFLYLSPERLGTELFLSRVEKMRISLIAVDEAHCISQWGYDFRPSYHQIADLRKIFPEVAVLALTATATPEVVKDIQDKLKFREYHVLSKSFSRKNLAYLVRETEDKPAYILRIVNSLKGSGIVYVRNRKKTKEIAAHLVKNGVSADYYHAGLDDEVRHKKQDAWKGGQCRVIVSTNAFGMGIDKPDVRFVIHETTPLSLEAYFQEAGRAGRDEKTSFAVLLTSEADRHQLQKEISLHFPEISYIKQVYQALGNFLKVPVGGGKFITYDFSLAEFCGAFKFHVMMAYNALKILEKEGYISFSEEVNNPSRIHFNVGRDDLYRFQVANATFDSFVKVLLRSYSGMFSDFSVIDEQVIASRARLPVETVYQYLAKLSSLKIIRYIPRKTTPTITFLEERLDDKTLYISPDNYRFRKEMFIRRIHAVLQYASDTETCRSQLLLRYFGQPDSDPCGICDVCTRMHDLGMKQAEFLRMESKILDLLNTAPSLPDEIANAFGAQKDKAVRVIQWLSDNGKIRTLSNGLLSIIVS